MFVGRRRRKRTRHCWPSRWWSSCAFPSGRTGRPREKRQVRREKSNFEMATERLRRSRMENRGHRAVPPHWLREMQEGRYQPDGGGNNSHHWSLLRSNPPFPLLLHSATRRTREAGDHCHPLQTYLHFSHSQPLPAAPRQELDSCRRRRKMRMTMRCDAEAGCCGSPLLPSEHLRPTSGFRPLATSENNSPEHPETPAPSTST